MGDRATDTTRRDTTKVPRRTMVSGFRHGNSRTDAGLSHHGVMVAENRVRPPVARHVGGVP